MAIHSLAQEIQLKNEDRYTLSFAHHDDALKAQLANELFSLLHDVDMHCRSLLKHGDISEETDEHLEKVREILYDSSAYTLLNGL